MKQSDNPMGILTERSSQEERSSQDHVWKTLALGLIFSQPQTLSACGDYICEVSELLRFCWADCWPIYCILAVILALLSILLTIYIYMRLSKKHKIYRSLRKAYRLLSKGKNELARKKFDEVNLAYNLMYYQLNPHSRLTAKMAKYYLEVKVYTAVLEADQYLVSGGKKAAISQKIAMVRDGLDEIDIKRPMDKRLYESMKGLYNRMSK